jgi:FlaA1/EpsC-like NDP-sugar epimerase
MTIPEACQLIIEGRDYGQGWRNLYIFDMGKPVKIIDLARKNDESSWLVYTERDIKYRLCV